MESIAIIGEPAWAEKASKPKDSRREPHAAKQGVGDDVSRVDPRNDFESESKWAKYLNCLRTNPPAHFCLPDLACLLGDSPGYSDRYIKAIFIDR